MNATPPILAARRYVDLRRAHNLAVACTKRPDPDLIAECMKQTR